MHSGLNILVELSFFFLNRNKKILPNNKDLFVSHVTWGPFEVMLKLMKHFKLNFHIKHLGINVF